MGVPVFDASRPIALRLPGPNGGRTIHVRYPSDDEWIDRQRRRKVLTKQLGRGQSETTILNREDADAVLMAKIRTEENEPETDAFEAVKLIEELATCDVDDVVTAGDGFRITTRVLGAVTVHVLKMPSAKDTFEFRRGFARVIDMQYGRTEATVNLAPVGAMYKKLLVSVEGYVDNVVPIIHQAVAVRAAIDAIHPARMSRARVRISISCRSSSR